MSTPPAGRKDHSSGTSPKRRQYDKELVRDRTLELLALRLGGPGKDQGARLVWDCPACGKQEKYSVKRAERKGGCLVANCRLAGYDDVFGMLSKLEDLDYHADFRAVLARAYELLGIEHADGRHASPKPGATKKSSTPKESADWEAPDGASRKSPSVVAVPRRAAATEDGGPHIGDGAVEDLDTLLELASWVYTKILELCPLETRDRLYLRTRGLSYETIRKGRFGTMTAPRAQKVKAVLQRELGREPLLKVPGFSEDEEDGRLKFTLTGNYILIPYHDAEGRVTTIEGRSVEDAGGDQEKGPRKTRKKYVTLRRAGNHLYLFPGYRPEDLLAVTEGVMGALVAAESGLAVGSIMGCQRFRASPSPEMLDGGPEDPLLELRGADFGGRTVPYIPDADDPPNPNVLKAAPKAACWIAEPQNGRAAICLLPEGMDLDEWLLSLPPRQRGARFAELLAGANPPEDGARLSPKGGTRGGGQSRPSSPDRSSPEPDEGAGAQAEGAVGQNETRDEAPPEQKPEPQPEPQGDTAEGNPPEGVANKDGRALTAEDVALRKAPSSPPRKGSKEKAGAKSGAGEQGSPAAQPGLWGEKARTGTGADAGPARREEEHTSRGGGGQGRGARKLRDEVYRVMIEALPLKEEHLEALGKKGVMRATASVGRLASLDRGRAKRVAADLAERFGAKRLLSVPGFEADGAGKARLTLEEDCLVLPCFDADGLLSGLEALCFDRRTGELDAEETVPLKGAGAHLYIFAYYRPKEIEGFCEGPLGALLAAQEDVVVGAIGGFRRYKAASGPGEGRQAVGAVLPELEGVDFDGRRLAYAPRAGAEVGEQNARYHEAATAARWLVERQDGSPAVASLGLRGGGEEESSKEKAVPAEDVPSPDDDQKGTQEARTTKDPDGFRAGGPTSLGEWILSLPEDEAQGRLRELFSESPARVPGEEAAHDDEDEGQGREGGEADEDEDPVPPPLSARVAYPALGLAAVFGAVLDILILRLKDFARYVGVGPTGEPFLHAGPSGSVRRLADSAPFEVLYQLHSLVAFAATLALVFVVVTKAHQAHLARWRAARMRLEERWELHLTPGKTVASGTSITPGEALCAALAWPVAYALSGWLVSATEALISLAARLEMAPTVGPLVADPTLASAYAATLFSAFVLWQRRSIRVAEKRMLQGKIRH